jgi:hypothetical protein
VADVAAEVERAAARLHGVEVLRERLELVPGHTGGQRVEAHVLHVLERAGQQRHAFGPDGRDGEPAVAGDDRRHAVKGGGRQVRVPEDLGVVVGVDVDETRGDDLAGGVEHAFALEVGADVGDAAGGDGDVGGLSGGARPVHHGAAPDDDVSAHDPIVAALTARCTRPEGGSSEPGPVPIP